MDMRYTLVVLVLVSVLEACNSVSEPDGAPTITGFIAAKDVPVPIAGPPTIHVKESAADPCGIIYLVRSSTRILRKSGGRLTEASEAALGVSTPVSVWSGIVLTSCPGQAGAEVVEILR